MAMTTADHPATGINPALFPGQSSGRQGFAGASGTGGDPADNIGTALAKAMSELMGDSTSTERNMNMGGGVPVYSGPPRTTTSLTHIFNGTAEVIQRQAAMSFATRPDPVKAIFAQQIVSKPLSFDHPTILSFGRLSLDNRLTAVFGGFQVTKAKIIVITPTVTGGGAQITPERAAARVVSTAAHAREFELARYGLDVIMNINAFHQPLVAADELNTKLKAQRLQMDEAWIGITYDAAIGVRARGHDIPNC